MWQTGNILVDFWPHFHSACAEMAACEVVCVYSKFWQHHSIQRHGFPKR